LDKDENDFPKYHLVEATSGSPAFEYCSWTCVKRRFGISFGPSYTKYGGCDDDSYPVASPE